MRPCWHSLAFSACNTCRCGCWVRQRLGFVQHVHTHTGWLSISIYSHACRNESGAAACWRVCTYSGWMSAPQGWHYVLWHCPEAALSEPCWGQASLHTCCHVHLTSVVSSHEPIHLLPVACFAGGLLPSRCSCLHLFPRKAFLHLSMPCGSAIAVALGSASPVRNRAGLLGLCALMLGPYNGSHAALGSMTG